MDFAYSPKVEALREQLRAFMDARVVPRLADWQREVEAGAWPPSMIEPLKRQARAEGLWNLFLPGLREGEPGTRLTNLEYAPLAEIMGRVHWASEIFNCSAPDTGNMELLHLFATPEQRARWLDPLLDGAIRSCFAMTEPDVASSDATNIATRIERAGAHYVINGRKWFITNAGDPRCRICIVMGVTDPAAEAHRRHSMVLVPMDTPGVNVVRNLPVMHHVAPEGHCEMRFADVRVPVTNLLGEEGKGFALAQARLGPGRIHHCMRSIGQCELALELLCARARERQAFGKRLHEHGTVAEWIALSRMQIDQARLLVLRACRPRCWRGRCRSTAPRASPPTPRSRSCGPGAAPCSSSTAPTRCICAPWRATRCAARRPTTPAPPTTCSRPSGCEAPERWLPR
jgi:acyl-CoA dehydrogenase